MTNISDESGPVESNEFSRLEADTVLLLDDTGATCQAYKAYHEGRFHFAKRLKPELQDDEFYREVFYKEFAVGYRLQSEFFPKYERIVENGKELSIYMEYVEGRNLQQILDEEPDYFKSTENVVHLLQQLLEGLSALHSMQVVHLDLKPSNVILTNVNKDVRIIDLGFCHTDAMPFNEGTTMLYAAPEQRERGKAVDARTDIYHVGMIMKCIDKKAKLSRPLRKIMRRALQQEPQNRYASAKKMLEDINLNASKGGIIKKTVLGVCAAMAIVASLLVWYNNKENSNETFVERYRKYNMTFRVIDKDSSSVEVVSVERIEQNEPDVAIPYSIDHEGKSYTVTAIADSAFAFNDWMTRISLPSTIRHIGNHAFSTCTKLQFFSMPLSVETFGEECFLRCYAMRDFGFTGNSITEIPRVAFVDDSLLTRITIPEGVTHIAQDAFTSCSRLQEIMLPSTLKNMDRGIFYNCTSLKHITIPASVETIGEYTFDGCTSLDTIVCLPPTPPTITKITDSKFHGVFLVPANSLDAYKAIPEWRELNISPM